MIIYEEPKMKKGKHFPKRNSEKETAVENTKLHSDSINKT
jgi:hypothetical protein